MRVAVIGSRSISIKNIGEYLPPGVTEIVSGGAHGIDTSAAEYAKQNNIRLTEFLPEYSRYGKSAPLKRNETIAEYADEAVAFWDGQSHGTEYTIKLFQKHNKKVTVIKVHTETKIG